MSDVPKLKVIYHAKSFSVDPLGIVSEAELKAAEGTCHAEFMRRMEREILAAMNIPREVIETQSRRERMLREIMGDDFIEDNAIAPAALAYWSLVAS